VAGGAVYVDGHYGKSVRVERWVASISAPKCQFCASVPGYSAAAASLEITAGPRAFSLTSLVAQRDAE
jgi:hypothetical protein